MLIRSETMLGTSHSWAVTMRSLLLQMQKLGHLLFLKSTNRKTLIPPALMSRLGLDCSEADVDLTYTLPRNFAARFKTKSKLKLAIYNYESSQLPKMWMDKINDVDYLLPSSNFSKQVFVDAGWPEKKCLVIPHGVNAEEFQNQKKFKLHNQKKFKFLNISIAHYRKNINLLLEAYYSAFDEHDDVSLVIKTDLALPNRKLYGFECNVKQQIIEAQRKFLPKRLPQVEIIQEKLESLVPLYNACDVVVSASSSEGFGLTLLEGLAAGKVVIAPRCTGQLDFLNDHNSILIDTIEIDAGTRYQYWVPTPGAKTFLPRVEGLSQAMLDAYHHHQDYQNKFSEERKETVEKFSWESAAKKILEIQK